MIPKLLKNVLSGLSKIKQYTPQRVRHYGGYVLSCLGPVYFTICRHVPMINGLGAVAWGSHQSVSISTSGAPIHPNDAQRITTRKMKQLLQGEKEAPEVDEHGIKLDQTRSEVWREIRAFTNRLSQHIPPNMILSKEDLALLRQLSKRELHITQITPAQRDRLVELYTRWNELALESGLHKRHITFISGYVQAHLTSKAFMRTIECSETGFLFALPHLIQAVHDYAQDKSSWSQRLTPALQNAMIGIGLRMFVDALDVESPWVRGCVQVGGYFYAQGKFDSMINKTGDMLSAFSSYVSSKPQIDEGPQEKKARPTNKT